MNKLRTLHFAEKTLFLAIVIVGIASILVSNVSFQPAGLVGAPSVIPRSCMVPTNGMSFDSTYDQKEVTFCNGNFNLNQTITITAKKFSLKCDNTHLIGNNGTGILIPPTIPGDAQIAIEGCSFSGFNEAIRANNTVFLTRNTFSENYYGVALADLSLNPVFMVSHNQFVGNRMGMKITKLINAPITLPYAKGYITDNLFQDNTHMSTDEQWGGIYLYDTSWYLLIQDNQFINNFHGIASNSSKNMDIRNNVFMSNGEGLLFDRVEPYQLYHNTFSQNFFGINSKIVHENQSWVSNIFENNINGSRLDEVLLSTPQDPAVPYTVEMACNIYRKNKTGSQITIANGSGTALPKVDHSIRLNVFSENAIQGLSVSSINAGAAEVLGPGEILLNLFAHNPSKALTMNSSNWTITGNTFLGNSGTNKVEDTLANSGNIYFQTSGNYWSNHPCTPDPVNSSQCKDPYDVLPIPAPETVDAHPVVSPITPAGYDPIPSCGLIIAPPGGLSYCGDGYVDPTFEQCENNHICGTGKSCAANCQCVTMV